MTLSPVGKRFLPNCFHHDMPAAALIAFLSSLSAAVIAASPLASCNVGAAFVLDSSVVAVFNASATCSFPFFPNLNATPSGSGSDLTVTIIAIGGGGGGGANGGGGGGAGAVVIQTSKISQGQIISVIIGAGGNAASCRDISSSCSLPTSGSSTSVTFSDSNVNALGGGFGGSRYGSGISGGSGGSGGGGGGCSGSCGGGGGSQVKQGNAGGNGFDAGSYSSGGGGGGFGQSGTAGSSCSSGNGGDGYELPFAPIMYSWVAGGGGGAATQYNLCPLMFGTNGLGQNGYGGGGRGSCGNGYSTIPSTCDAQPGSAGALFVNFSFTCPPGSGALPGFFSGSPCVPCLPGSYGAGTVFCLPCPPGFYNPSAGSKTSSDCTPCSAGTYNLNPGSNSSLDCIPCPAGTYNPSRGSQSQSACMSCAAGTYSDSPGRASVTACSDCPAHTYNPIEGSSNISSCVPCPSGTCTSKSGSINASSCQPCPSAAVTPSSVPLWILGSAAASSGHLPRVLELVQFLSIYCTSLASQQQNSISAFQIGSFTGALAATKQEYCGVCPGQCLQPLVTLTPTFALLSSLSIVTLVSHALIRRTSAAPPVSAEDRLLAADCEQAIAAERRFATLQQKVVNVGIEHYRNFIESCSSYVIMPVMFVFVLNAWPSAFSSAEMWDRVMIVMLPIIALMFRSFVVFKRFVRVTGSDQRLMLVNSTCYCCIATTLSVFFMLNREERSANSNTTFSSDPRPQYIVLVLLSVQLIVQMFIRSKAKEPFIFYNITLPWHLHSSTQEPAYSPSDSCSHTTRYPFTASAVEFVIANYFVLSQITMVAAGLMSTFAPFSSGPRSHEASITIGSIPLFISGVLLLRAVLHFTIFVWRTCIGKQSKHPQLQLHSLRGISRNSRY